MDSAEITTIGVGKKVFQEKTPLSIVTTILFHPDVSRIGDLAILSNIGVSFVCRLSRLEPEFKTPQGRKTGPLGTPFVSRTPISLEIDSAGSLTVKGPPNGTLRINGKTVACSDEPSFTQKSLNNGVVLLVGDAVVLLIHLFDPNVVVHSDDLGMIGHNCEMDRLRTEILKVADLDKRVLIRGESGTGKELVASAICAHSPRADKIFEKVNITEIPNSIAERELFGAAKHAGTGEPGHEGYFVRADGGTLFLDEIGDLDFAVQPKLLRAVETGEVQILGARKKTKVDVRILAGTDVDLEEAVRRGQFKTSLLERLSAYTVHIPPLRRRRDDIGRLFLHFLRVELEKLGEENKLTSPSPGKLHWLPADFVEKLALFNWPGNIRQLRNVTARIAVLNRGCSLFQRDDRIEAMLKSDVSINIDDKIEQTDNFSAAPSPLDRFTDEEIVEKLELNGFNVSQTARALNVERAKFYRDLKKRDIDVEELRTAWILNRPE